MEKRDNPSTPSGAYGRMQDAWRTINDILAGPDCIRAAGERYLPKNPAEEKAEYDRRLKSAPWQPEFTDILQSLSSKPFGREIALVGKPSDRIKALAEDIDGKGNNLTAFSRPVFRGGVAYGMQGILVDNTGTGEAKTQAEEQAAGVRPYWVSIAAADIIDLKTAFVGGREQPYHVRIKECRVERDGYAEKTRELVRELNRTPVTDKRGRIVSLGPPTWVLHEKDKTAAGGEEKWVKVEEGAFSPLTEIPLALFWAGEREGSQFTRPPLYAQADSQIDLYRRLSRDFEAFYSVGYPMYSANGMGPPAKGDKIETGPNRILFAATPGASWDVISAEADSLRVLLEDTDKRADALRRLGMQPLTQKTGGVTATASSIEGAKAHTTVEAWALGLKDVIEQAFVFTAQWLGEEPSVEVDVDTDFSVEAYAQAPLDALFKARDRGDISQRTYWDGLRRFDVLSPGFDAEAEEKALIDEMPDPTATDDITGALTPPTDPALDA